MSATSTGETPPKRRRWKRWVVVAVVLVALAGIAYYLALPRLAESYIRGKLADLSSSTGRTITFDSFELDRLNRYHFFDFRVSDNHTHADHDFLTASRVTITLDRTRLFGGDLVVRAVEVEGPVLYLRDYDDGDSNYAALWRSLRVQLGLEEAEFDDEPAGVGEAADPPESRGLQRLLADFGGGALPSLRVTGGRVDVAGAARDNPPPGLRELDLEVVPTGNGLACRFNLSTGIDPVTTDLLARPFQRLELRGQVDPDDQVGEVMISTGEPMDLPRLPGLPEVLLRVREVGFEYPYTFRVGGLEVLERRTRNPLLRAPSVTLTLQELTLVPADFHLSLLEVDGLRVYLDVEPDGRSNVDRLLGEALGLPPRLLAQLLGVAPPTEETPPAGETDTTPEVPAEPSPWMAELERRRWWEVAPQTTVMTDAALALTLRDEDGQRRRLDLTVPELRASKRLLNFQMDVTARAELHERGGPRLVAGDLDFVFFYLTEQWGFNLQVEELDGGRILALLPLPNPMELSRGRFSGWLAVNENRPDRTLDVEGSVAARDVAFVAEALDDARIDDIDVSYDFAALLNGQGGLSFERGALTFNGVEAQVLLDLEDFDGEALIEYLLGFKDADRPAASADEPDPLPWSEVRLRVEMPRQPVMDVFRAIPSALRARLGGTEMTGEVGWQLDATASYRLDRRGRLRVDIPRPAVAQVLDDGVELVRLPEDVDVTRLLEPDFEFLFSDGIGETRLLQVGAESPRWVPLEEISPNMVVSILNTEDQSFFNNRGFNWTQFRRVLGDLLAERELGRGASTITMQLAKNVFLSRERQVSRKLAEMFLTYWIDRLIPKERILEVYLNVIEFGPGINGVAEAAEHYFGKLPADLTLSEATFLVSIVPNPRAYHFYYEQGAVTDRWWSHMQRYMQRLLAREVITQEEFEEAIAAPPDFYLREEGDPALRPSPPEEPALPPDVILPFLSEGEGPPGRNLHAP